jgi:outer membrane cobalamin receptor
MRAFWGTVRSFIFFLGLCLVLSGAAVAAVGTVRGAVTDPTGALVPHAIVRLGSQLSGYSVTAVADEQGRYVFNGVPFAQFTLTAEAQGFQPAIRTDHLKSSVPLTLNLQLALSQTKESVTVTERAPLLETASTTTHHDIEEDEIERSPSTQPQVALSSLLESVPGVIPEENGRLHVRGSEGQVQYVVDGVPIFENMSGVFSTALDEDDLHSSDIVTGNLPAEFAGRTSAVVTVDTKSGLNAPWNGSLSLFGGSFDSGGANLEVSGNLNKKVGVFLSSQTNRTRRYLDPPEIESLHNAGGAAQLFTRFDFAPTEHDSLHLNLSTNGTDYQVANTQDQQDSGQRQRQERRDDSESLGWTHLFNNTTVGEVLMYRRASIGRLLDPDLTGTPYFVGVHDRTETEGLHASLSHEWGRHSFKFGVQGHRLGLGENFALAATDPDILSDPTNPASQFPIDNPFRFRDKRNGWEVGGFGQDRIRIGHLTVDLGLRLDKYSLLAKNAAASPRVGLAYYLEKTGTVLRASYNRMFQTPPIENLLLASAPQAAVFVPGEHYGPVPPEWQNVYEIGLQQQITKHIRLDVTRYVKNARNFSDDEQFLETGVVFPLTIARGDVRGLEARLDVRAYHGLGGYLSYANSKAIGTTPITGGLPIGSGEQLTPNLKFPGDQDERNEGQFGVTYARKSGLWTTFTGRFDSGVPSEIDPSDATSGEIDPRIAAELDFNRGRIKPRALFNMAAGYELMKESAHPVSLQFGVNNLTDRLYLFNYLSIFSGTHIGRPREFTGRVTFHLRGR